MMNKSKYKYVVVLFCLLLFQGSGKRNRFVQETFFENTPYELNVYRIIGRNPDKTMLVIGGIQGNEPTGYLAADHYVDINLERGTLIMVPRANFNTIIRDLRGYNGDMNRKFTDKNQGVNYEEKIVQVLKGLIAEADVLLNLHEGSGFYSDTWVSDIVNPMRYGQSIIADADVYATQDSTHILDLEHIARQVTDKVNEKIENPQYHFHFNNHNTFSDHTRHSEQRTSATYYALSNFAIPAFGIESSKAITDIEIKVRHQIWIINEFMRIFDIVPEVPGIYLEYPELFFVVVTINGSESQIVPAGKTVRIKSGDRVEISHVESNYERGLSVDIQNYGTINDFNSPVTINSSTKVTVRKDKFYCGEIDILVDDESKQKDEYNYIVLDVNGEISIFDKEQNIELVTGDVFKIIDTVPSSKNKSSLRLNMFGFVPQRPVNTADDRNLVINTATDMIQQYSKNGRGNEYSIRVEQFNEILSTFNIVLKKAELFSIGLRHKQKLYRLGNDETIEIPRNDTVKILDVMTSAESNANLQVNFKGFVGNGDGEDRNLDIPLNDELLKKYAIDDEHKVFPITVTQAGKLLGKVYVKLTD